MKNSEFDSDKISIILTIKEQDLILNNVFIPPELRDRLKLAVTQSKGIKISYSLFELDELLGFIAAEANHCEDSKIKVSLDRLFDRLSDIYDSHI